MTSNINYLSINENFPVPGEDNDTQVFRDNFDTIKTSLRLAKEEVTDLQDNAARTDLDNDFNNKIVSGAIFQNTYDKKIDLGTLSTSTINIDYENGSYQVLEITGTVETKSIQFLNFPTFSASELASVGKITLEIYGNGSVLEFITSGGTVLKKSADFPSPLSADSPNVGTSGNPIIIEVWQHRSDRIFLNYIGLFES